MRHFQKLLFKLAYKHVGALHQRGHFVQECVVVNRFAAATHLCGGSKKLACNFCTTLFKAGNNSTVTCKRGGIGIGCINDHWRNCGFETVALGFSPCPQTQYFNWHDVCPVQSKQTMHRAHEAHGRPTIRQLIAHHFGNRKLCQGVLQCAAKPLVQGNPLGDQVKIQCLCFAIHGAL